MLAPEEEVLLRDTGLVLLGDEVHEKLTAMKAEMAQVKVSNVKIVSRLKEIVEGQEAMYRHVVKIGMKEVPVVLVLRQHSSVISHYNRQLRSKVQQ